MKISFTTVPGNLTLSNGYGIAGFNMITSLQALGHTVPYQDPSADVEISFCQPTYTDWSSPDAYHIQYTPWESTGLPFGWVDHFNESDEVWTPSDLIASWYRDAGVTKDIKVYEHGIDHDWTARRRYARDRTPIKYLSVGSPAIRKGAQETVDSFVRVFGESPAAHLTVKSHGPTETRLKDAHGRIRGPVHLAKNITLDQRDLSRGELMSLFDAHDVLVYPSAGEGFGLIPLEGMASGMPTITLPAWAPYRRFILPELAVESSLIESPWQYLHPGKVFKPSADSLDQAMRTSFENFDTLAGKAYKKAFVVHDEYDWIKLTEEAFAPIVKRFG